MLKPKLYLDTSVFSAYWFAGGNADLISRRNKTREWWDLERQSFQLQASAFVEKELTHGVFRRQPDCLKMCRRVNYVIINRRTHEFQEKLIRERIIPENKPIDAWHLSMAVIHSCDYLLTWNYSHLANLDVQARLFGLCRREALFVPWLVTPESIPQVRFGHVVRRRPRDV